jgi:hypothetical protein
MRRRLHLAFLVVSVGAASAAHAFQCYAMFDAKNTRVYQTAVAPIDLSRPISDEMARRFPSRYLVISDTGSCVEINNGSTASASQLLSNRTDGDFSGTSPAEPVASPYDAPAQAPTGRRGRR